MLAPITFFNTSSSTQATGNAVAQTAIVTTTGTYDPGGHHTFYSGVAWINESEAGPLTIVDVYALANSPNLVYTEDFGAGFGSSRNIVGVAFQESTPPGEVVMIPATTDANVYFMTYDGSKRNFASGLTAGTIQAAEEDSSAGGVLHIQYAFGGQSVIGKYRGLFVTNTFTALSDGAGHTSGNLAKNGGCVDSRMYCRVNAKEVGWFHTTTDNYTQIATYANTCGIPLVGGQYGGGPDTRIYVQSGATGEANKILQLNFDGVAMGTSTLTSVTATDYGNVTKMAFDYVNRHLWLQYGTAIHCVNTDDMTEIVRDVLTNSASLLEPIGHPNGGAIAAQQSASAYDTISRLSLTTE